MPRRSQLLTGLVLALHCAAADGGGFVFGSTRTPGTGPQAGMDVLRFFAKLSPDTRPSDPYYGATGLKSVHATLFSMGGPLKVRFFDQNGDGIPDADPTGQFTQSDAEARTVNDNNGSFIRAGNPAAPPNGVFRVLASQPLIFLSQDTDLDGKADAGFDPAINYGQLKLFRIAGVEEAGVDTGAVTEPFGALFAMAVVPAGTVAYPTGIVSADVGPLGIFLDTFAPEPGALAWFGLSGFLLRRRHRVPMRMLSRI